jgi:Kef-type K+ transport system membrane component KefB
LTDTALLALSALLVFAYLLDVFGRRTRLPPVVLLILSGIAARHAMDGLGLHLGWVDPLVPIIGTLCLILIVLEDALDLSLQRERLPLIARASFVMCAGFVVCVVGFTLLFQRALALDFVPAV